jgi:predicted transposase YbfD/YdcC
MPAAPSSLTDPAIGQLLTAAQALAGDRARLLPVLAAVPDPHARRGVRHRMAVILGLAVCAVLAGARSFTAIAEWAADADQATLDALGVPGVVPCESTFRRTLQDLDADALDDAAGTWAQQRTAPGPGTRRMIAVDGKTLRGSGTAGQPGRHLLAALDHVRGVVLGQADVEAKTNEIPLFATLLDRIDLAGAVITADAMHAQRAHARYLAGQRGAHYLVTVKGNQPRTYQALNDIAWEQIPSRRPPSKPPAAASRPACIQVAAAPAGLKYPGMKQAALIERYTTAKDKKGKAVTRSETVLILTTAGADQAPPADLLALNRGHWAATEATHYIRDVDLREDSSRARAPGAPRFMATVGNAVLNLLRIHGVTNIAAERRRLNGSDRQILKRMSLSPG